MYLFQRFFTPCSMLFNKVSTDTIVRWSNEWKHSNSAKLFIIKLALLKEWHLDVIIISSLHFFVKRSRKKEQKSTIEATAKRFFENERTIIKTNIILPTSPTMRKSLHTHKHRFAPKICAAKWNSIQKRSTMFSWYRAHRVRMYGQPSVDKPNF